jgi:hypothetical protein
VWTSQICGDHCNSSIYEQVAWAQVFNQVFSGFFTRNWWAINKWEFTVLEVALPMEAGS